MKRFNLNLDDFSPHPNTNDLFWCNKLIEKYPEIKINLFVPAAYARLGEEPYFLSEYPEWVENTKRLPSNYRINLHGFYHRRVDKRYPKSNNNEFELLDKKETLLVLKNIMGEFKRVGIEYKNTFRAPGWHLSLDAVNVLIDNGFIIAGNNVYYNAYKDKVHNIRWVNYNWDMTSAYNLETNDVVAFGHTSNWTNNYMNEERYNLIVNLLSKEEYRFDFIEDFVEEK